MKEHKFKIGFSEIGGIYVGKNIKSSFHKHYAITVLISFGGSFKITDAYDKECQYKVAIIQKNISYNLETNKNDPVAFIHIVPYSTSGIALSNTENAIQNLATEPFAEVLSELKIWSSSSENDIAKVEDILNKVSSIPNKAPLTKPIIDERIKKSLDLIMKSEHEKLPVEQIAQAVHLSVSHFTRLFKKEIGMTYRKFVLHSKLVKSIFAMYQENSLTEAAFIGGFADQPHFTRTFKGNFGIKPSSSRK